MDEYVNQIIDLAKIAYDNDDIPVGAIVVKNNKIIGKGYNSRNKSKSIVGHAEINAIEMAIKDVGDWRLDECEMYVTLLPCLMCTGAIIESRIKKVYYLCDRTNVCINTNKLIDAVKIDNVENCEKYMKILRLFFENKRNKS